MHVTLTSGDKFDDKRLHDIFLCSTQAGMNRSKRTNTLVLVSNHIKSIYEDKWIDDVFHYTGMGTEGDQKLTAQNKTLYESDINGIEVHLFEKFKKGEYTYRGIVKLASPPYQSTQPDKNNQLRKVWVFPLKLIQNPAPIQEEDFDHANLSREKAAKKLSDEELLKRVQADQSKPGIVEVKNQRRQRNHYIVELVNRRAKGICQLCNEPAPFIRKDGTPYLEVHHIVSLAEGGEDSLTNTVALCPNCHRKMHSLALTEDIEKLKLIASKT